MSPATTEPFPTLRREGDVFLLDLGNGENRFNPKRNAALLDALHEVTSEPAPRALVTVATGKFWSNGLDLDWMGAHPDEVQSSLDEYHRVIAAFLEAGVATVAAVQGHAFAAGAMLAVAHDMVIMRADRGYWCIPEADLGLPFTRGMTALLQARLPRRTAHLAMTTARRYGGSDAVAAGIADEAVSEDAVLRTAVERATELTTKNPETLHAIKRRMYEPTLAALRLTQQM